MKPVTGYSSTPLQKKLGIKEGFNLYISKPPLQYFDWISPMPKNVQVKDRLAGEFDFIHLFAKDKKVFEKEFVRFKKHLTKDGMMWVSWPKKISKVE